MCDWLEESQGIANQMNGRPVLLAFALELLFKKNPLEVTRGCCSECGRQLSYDEMYPPGRPPRYMCQRCYKGLVDKARHGQCLLCKDKLPFNQYQRLMRNPRELKNAFCRGKCLDYHKVLAGRVLGVPFNLDGLDRLQVPRQVYPAQAEQRQISYDHEGNMIDANPVRTLPLPGGKRR